MQLRYVIRKQVSRVDLQKDGTTSIGIVLKDGVKTGSRPVIKSIKKGSVAYRSHCVSEKDAIVSVCGQDARGMSRRVFKHLLREAESKIELELEYQIQEACLNKCGVYRMERIVLKLKKESESFGFVLRNHGLACLASRGCPVISHIKDGGPADRDGRLKAGDKLLQIDGENLELLSLSEVAQILQAKDEATFTIEYKIALIENSQIRFGERTSLEIDCLDADLGLVLGSSGSRMVIEEIRKGSLADRCGAFRVGDDILAIKDIDVAFLSASKANNLLRSFKKDPGILVLVANTERLAPPRPNSYFTREKIQPLNEMPSQLTPEMDQQVPSNDNSLASGNSPQSLFNGGLGDETRCLSRCDYLGFQIKTIAMLREIVKNISILENFIPSLTSNNPIGLENNSHEIESNRNQIIQRNKLSHLKFLSTLIKNSTHSVAMHFVKNCRIDASPQPENGVLPSDCCRENPQPLNKENVVQELMKHLVELYTKKLLSKSNLEKLQLEINTIDLKCRKCKESCVLASLTTHKILLVTLLNGKIDYFLVTKLIEDIFTILPCKDCRVGSVPQTGSEVLTTPHFDSMNPLDNKASCTTQPLKRNTPLNLAGLNGSDTPGATSVNILDNLRVKFSSCKPSLLSSQTGLESPMDGSSTNSRLSRVQRREAIAGLNCKSNSFQTSNFVKSFQQMETPVNGSQWLTLPSYPPRDQNENLLNWCTTPDERGGFSGNSTPETLIETSYDGRSNSFSHHAEVLPGEDNATCGERKNGRNYTSNIHKKIFREKGLLKSQRKNSKSVEVIADSENESLNCQLSKSNIQKHSSEPHKLSTVGQLSTDNVQNRVEKDEHLYANVEISDDSRKSDGANAEVNTYWSPFHRSDFNDSPNILDIPNWSAKSSHSLKQMDPVTNERTMQDTMDVTLKNEGKGYGLRVEFPDSPSEESTCAPCITAVSSQGAAHKIGILMKGDRILTINGQSTIGMSPEEFEHLKEDAFNSDEVLITVQFDVVLKDLQFGIFDVCVTKTSKTGLVYNDFKKGSPLVVKGIVKGSPAHRCGSLMPGDEVLQANNIRQEFYDVSKNTFERSELVIIRVRRQAFKEKIGDETMPDRDEPIKAYDLTRTSIHSNHDSNNMFLDQELTLYRDPVARDFGFLIGQDQISKTIYVTGIRPDGPADCSKVIKENDLILKVNGIDLEVHKNGPIIPLFQPTGNCLELKTRRILKYE